MDLEDELLELGEEFYRKKESKSNYYKEYYLKNKDKLLENAVNRNRNLDASIKRGYYNKHYNKVRERNAKAILERKKMMEELREERKKIYQRVKAEKKEAQKKGIRVKKTGRPPKVVKEVESKSECLIGERKAIMEDKIVVFEWS
jgi:hypothetical protein